MISYFARILSLLSARANEAVVEFEVLPESCLTKGVLARQLWYDWQLDAFQNYLIMAFLS